MKTVPVVLALVVLWVVWRALVRPSRRPSLSDAENPHAPGSVEYRLARREKIAAIKVFRELHGVGLKEAKEAVEQIDARARS